jgi:GNAT superfamily N-acetyltransferase
MSTTSMTPLTGQDTLIASWHALARTSRHARLARTQSAVAAVFPAWSPLNNAILLDAASPTSAAAAAVELRHLYRSAGVASWALWLPSSTTSLAGADEVTAVGGMRRDTTTLVMELSMTHPLPTADGVRRTTLDASGSAGEEPIPVDDLPETEPQAGPMDAWVIVRDGLAVAGAWSLVEGTDCGIYAVETVPEWRRRGLAQSLMQHILGDAYRRGARTATLQSTPMGEPLYRSLGFVPVGRYDEWVPS